MRERLALISLSVIVIGAVVFGIAASDMNRWNGEGSRPGPGLTPPVLSQTSTAVPYPIPEPWEPYPGIAIIDWR